MEARITCVECMGACVRQKRESMRATACEQYAEELDVFFRCAEISAHVPDIALAFLPELCAST